MTYHVYENWEVAGHKARIHLSSRPVCNNGKGFHPGSSDKRGTWHGPFATFAEALDVAHKSGGPVSACKHCRPH